MRIWIGKEREHSYMGMLTMFIETVNLTHDEVKKAIECLDNNPEVEAVYLGAGRQNTIFHEKSLKTLLERCNESDLKVTVETTELNQLVSLPIIPDLLYNYEVKIINRIDLPKAKIVHDILELMVYKIDTTEYALFTDYELHYRTPLKDVKDNMYTGTDRIIYEDK